MKFVLYKQCWEERVQRSDSLQVLDDPPDILQTSPRRSLRREREGGRRECVSLSLHGLLMTP